MKWEEAILCALQEKGGIASLKDFYAMVSSRLAQTKTKDSAHVIRAYLRRLKRKGLIRQIGLSLYALPHIAPKNPIYEQALSESDVEKIFSKLAKKEIHGFIEGMLVELGNDASFETYTPDKHIVFNGKSLSDLCAHRALPPFTYKEIVNSASMIDVVWLKDGFPAKTFDVEHTTNFQSALLRAYSLRFFKTTSFIVASSERFAAFQKRLQMKPFADIADGVKFASYQDVYDAYRSAMESIRVLKKNKIFT